MADIRDVLVEAVLHVLLEDASAKKRKTQKKKKREWEETIPRLRRSRWASVRRFN